MAEQRVVFRRINGRLIPIRIKDDTALTKKQVAAGGVATLGAGVAAAGGVGAYRLNLHSANLENFARVAQRAKGGTQQAAKFLRRSSQFHRARNFSIAGGAFLGGLLLDQARKMLGKRKKKELTTADGVKVSASFGTGLAIAGSAYYQKLLRPKTVDAFKRVVQLAKGRKTFQYILKGL